MLSFVLCYPENDNLLRDCLGPESFGNAETFMKSILDCVLRRKAISEEVALQIAQDICVKKGWEWVPPIKIERHWFRYRIMTNARCKGGNVNIVIDSRTGSVIKANLVPY